MIGYVTLGSNDIRRAASFYDAVLAEIGARRWRESDHSVWWYRDSGQPVICITKPYDGHPASFGNGVMVALNGRTQEGVQKAYAKAIALGGKDEGPAGPRTYTPGFYAGYFRDLEGNKLCVFCLENLPGAGRERD